jgi:hypothetical protein
MAILLLALLILAGLAVGDAIVENTTTATVTIAGQEMGGLTLGGWLTAFAVLGFISAYILLGMLASARRSRVRRRAMRSTEREMAERVAELERENTALRDRTVDDDSLPHREPAVRDDTLVEQPSHGDGDGHPGDWAGTGPGRRPVHGPAPVASEPSVVDDYPPSTTHDAGDRDRWPEPGDRDSAAVTDRPSSRRERLTGRS